MKKSKPILPSIANENNSSPEDELIKLAKIGLKNRLENFIIKKKKIYQKIKYMKFMKTD